MTEVIDISRDKESGDIAQFTIINDTGQPELKKATPENVLLYDPEDKLPFDNGMRDFLSGNEALVFQDDDPTVMVAPTTNEYCYIVRVGDNTVETTPEQATEALSRIRDAAIDGDVQSLIELYDDIMSKQVRRGVVNALLDTFDESSRIQKKSDGWLTDGFYLVDWTASMYAKHDDPDENDVIRGGGGVTETDRSYEFVQLSLNRDTEPVEVYIGGESFRLTEREILFLAKVKWLLDRRHYHPDTPMWMYVDRKYAEDIDWNTGEYTGNCEQDGDGDADGDGDGDGEPDLGEFSL